MTRESYVSCNLCDCLAHSSSIFLKENHTGKLWWQSEDNNIHLCPRCQSITSKALAIDEFAKTLGIVANVTKTKRNLLNGVQCAMK